MEITRHELDGTTLAVTTDGPSEGPPVVLLHGFPDRASLWHEVIPPLVDAGYRVVAPDLRGFGESDQPQEVDAYRMRTLVADVTGLLDALDLRQAHLVGHDWGAALAWGTAMFAPERVSSLTALSVGHPSTRGLAGHAQSELSWYMLWFLLPGVAEEILPKDDWAFFRSWGWRDPGGEEAVRRQVQDLARPGALTAALNWYRANIDPRTFGMPASDQLPHVTCPTMGVWSTRDGFLGEAQMRESGCFVDAPWRYEVVEDVDHWLPVRAPARVSELVLDFLASTAGRPA